MCLLRKHLNFQSFLGSLQILLAGCQSLVPSVYLPADSLQVVFVCQFIAAEGVEYPHRGFCRSQRTLQKFGTAHNIEAAIIGILPVVGSPGNLYQSPALILHAIALLGVAEVFPALVGRLCRWPVPLCISTLRFRAQFAQDNEPSSVGC